MEENLKNELEKIDTQKNDIIITINDNYFYKNPLNNSDDDWEPI